MDVRASLRYLRISPRKVRLVLGLIRGRDVAVALQQLANLPKRSSLPLMKLLKSAVANAEHNFKLEAATLFIKQAYADEGPKLKRYMPRAMGRATPVLKRMSHVTVILGQRNAPAKTAGKGRNAGAKPETASKMKLPLKDSHASSKDTKARVKGNASTTNKEHAK